MPHKKNASLTPDLDLLTSVELLERLQKANEEVPSAVRKALPTIDQALTYYVETLRNGGRILYVGAGTSGRLAALDAAECPVTFGTDPHQIMAVMAGGNDSLIQAQENAEDDVTAAVTQLTELQCSDKDLIIGISASGSTPYAISAVDHARQMGARTIGVTCTARSLIENRVDLCIVCAVGPEVLFGSTRLKAGTAQKMVLNLLSTAAMIRLGKTYQSWMVSFRATNQKLKKRAIEMVVSIAGVDENSARAALEANHFLVKETILSLKKGCSNAQATQMLQVHAGNLRGCLSCGCGPQTDCKPSKFHS